MAQLASTAASGANGADGDLPCRSRTMQTDNADADCDTQCLIQQKLLLVGQRSMASYLSNKTGLVAVPSTNGHRSSEHESPIDFRPCRLSAFLLGRPEFL